jgi:NAD(P)-dependent dehydrogenase (short-subunit alcohol dehydrogenase family)
VGRLNGTVAIIVSAAGVRGSEAGRLWPSVRVVMPNVQEHGHQVTADLGDPACFLHHDITGSAAWSRVIVETLRRFGKLDALVGNAAMLNAKPLIDTSAADLEQHFRVNQIGLFVGMKAVIKPLRRRKPVRSPTSPRYQAYATYRVGRLGGEQVVGTVHEGEFRGRSRARRNSRQCRLSLIDQPRDARGELRANKRLLRQICPVGPHRQCRRSGGTGRIPRLRCSKLYQWP